MLNYVVYFVLGAIVAAYALETYFCRQRHAQEPKIVRPKFPLIGHVLGMAMYGNKYYEILGPKQPEIYAMPILLFKLYVVNSRHLFPVIMRHAKTLSFHPFTKIASKVWCDASDEFMEMHEENHPWIRDLYKDMRTTLAPGKDLDYQNQMTGDSIAYHLEVLDQKLDVSGDATELDLSDWTYDVLSVAATDGVYGKNNPFKDPQVVKDFWLWQTAVKKLIVMPKTFFGIEMAARDRVFVAFEKYWKSDYSDAAAVTLARKRLYDREGVSLKDQGGNQASFNIALLPNTIPTAFWSLYDILQRPTLLRDVRTEVEGLAVERGEKGNITLDVSALKDCSLLLSAYQESQRTRSIHANIREALQDTMIESPATGQQYFIAKGSYVMMPSGPIHKNGEIWGSSVDTFDPYRFAGDNAVTRKGESYAFMPWGSAPHLCPARQFASTEVILFVALMIMRYDVASIGGGTTLPTIQVETGELTTVQPPKGKVNLKLSRRKEWIGDWHLKFGDSGKKVPLATG